MLLLAEGQAGEACDPPQKKENWSVAVISELDFSKVSTGRQIVTVSQAEMVQSEQLTTSLTTRLSYPKTGFSSIFEVFTAVMLKSQVSRDAEILRFSETSVTSSVNTQKTRVLCSICIPVLAPPIGWPRTLSTSVYGWKNSRGCSWPVISTNNAIASCPEPRA